MRSVEMAFDSDRRRFTKLSFVGFVNFSAEINWQQLHFGASSARSAAYRVD